MATLEDIAAASTGIPPGDPSAPAPAALAAAVVMVVRDHVGLTLRALLALARAQQDAEFETVVVDDASSDATPKLLASVEGHFTGLREERARGFAAGVDRAAAASRANVIVVMREDLIATAGWLTPLLESFEDLSVGAALPRVIDGRGREVCDPGWPCLAIRRAALADVGGFHGAAEPSRSVKATLLEAVRARGWELRSVPTSVLLALPEEIAAD